MSQHTVTGYALLRDPRLNKGTAFSDSRAPGTRARGPAAACVSSRSSCNSRGCTRSWPSSTTTCRTICCCPTCRRATRRCSMHC